MKLVRITLLTVLSAATLAAAGPHDPRKAKTREFMQRKKSRVVDELQSRRGGVDMARFDCDNCLHDFDTGVSIKLKLLFIESKDIVENEAAARAAIARGNNHSCGSCCSDPEKAVPECFVVENWNTGWIAKPLMEVLIQTGANLVALTPANFTSEARSMAPEGHPFSICPFEVLTENVDVCVGDFWETLDRRNIVPFTTPLEINTFKLVTVAVDQEDFTPIHLLDMFKPFSAGVWGMMIMMFAFMAMLMWIVSEEDSEEFDRTELFPAKRGFVKGFWVSAMGYLAGNQFTSNKWSARFIVMGFSFFLATTVAAYTANLASFMVQKPTDVGKVTSLADLVARKKTLCAVNAVKNMLTEPGIEERLYVEDSGFVGSMFELMRAGTCDAALVGSMEYLLYVQAGSVQYDICTTPEDPNFMGGFFCGNEDSTLTRYDLSKCQCGDDMPLYDVAPANCPINCVAPHSKFCDVIEVLDPSLSASFNYALPAASWVEPFISSGIIASKVSGKYFQDHKEELIATNPPSCPTTSPQGRINNAQLSSAISLGVTFMSGTFFFAGIIMLLGILCHFAAAAYHRHVAEPEAGHFVCPGPSVDADSTTQCAGKDAPGRIEPAPACISTTQVESFRDAVDELKQPASVFRLQTEFDIAGMEERIDSMASQYQVVHRGLSSVLSELSALRLEQAEARAQASELRFSKSGRVPGGSFQAQLSTRQISSRFVSGGANQGHGDGDKMVDGEHRQRTPHRRTRR